MGTFPILRPFRAFGCGTLFPRALPWAEFLQPFRLKLHPRLHGAAGRSRTPQGSKNPAQGNALGTSWPLIVSRPERAQETCIVVARSPDCPRPCQPARPEVSHRRMDVFGEGLRHGNLPFLRPFRAFGCGTLFPRALPWAGFLPPFRLKLPSFPRSAWECVLGRSASRLGSFGSLRAVGPRRRASGQAFPRGAWERGR
jgi:hypothetical protein